MWRISLGWSSKLHERGALNSFDMVVIQERCAVGPILGQEGGANFEESVRFV